MDIWNVYLHEIKHKKKMENIKNNNILKRYEKSYEEIRNHVLETPETKENHLKLLETYQEKNKYKCLKYFF